MDVKQYRIAGICSPKPLSLKTNGQRLGVCVSTRLKNFFVKQKYRTERMIGIGVLLTLLFFFNFRTAKVSLIRNVNVAFEIFMKVNIVNIIGRKLVQKFANIIKIIEEIFLLCDKNECDCKIIYYKTNIKYSVIQKLVYNNCK